jgi:hypothetical protein
VSGGDLPAGFEGAIRSAIKAAFEAGVRWQRDNRAANLGQVQAYAVNQLAHAWILAQAQAEARAQDPHS